MGKQILTNELAEIITGLLVNPDLLGELDSPEKHADFIRDIGQVVADYCGGDINGAIPCDLPGDGVPSMPAPHYLSVQPNDSLPSLESCIWSFYDPDGWEDEAGSDYDLDSQPAPSKLEIQSLRASLQGLLLRVGPEAEAVRA